MGGPVFGVGATELMLVERGLGCFGRANGGWGAWSGLHRTSTGRALFCVTGLTARIGPMRQRQVELSNNSLASEFVVRL